MKKMFFIASFTILLAACKKEITSHTISVTGQLLEEVTLQPLPNAPILVAVTHSYKDSWGNSYIDTLDSKWIASDSKGDFAATAKYRDESNVLSLTIFPGDPVYVPWSYGAKIGTLKTNSHIIFNSRTWEPLRVKVKNLNPFDDNDQIAVSFLERNTSFMNSIVYKIVNHGIENIHLVSPGVDFRLYPAWKGKNVDAEIYGHLQSSTNYIVFWTVIKNGLRKEYKSEELVTQKGKLNEFTIEY